jgi:hypothetical protein
MVSAHPYTLARTHTLVYVSLVHTARSHRGREEGGGGEKGGDEERQNDSLENNYIILQNNYIILQNGLCDVYQWIHAATNVYSVVGSLPVP